MAEEAEDANLLGQFYVRALEAKGLKLKMGSGTRNSFVQFRLGESKRTVQTPVVWKSLHPVWKEKNSFNFEVVQKYDKQGNPLEHEFLDVSLWDKNAGISDTFLGYISIRINTQKSHSRVLDKWFTIMKREKATGELHMQLRFVNKRDRQVMIATEESMEDAFAGTTQVEFDDTDLQLVKADLDDDSLLSKTNELIMHKGREMMGSGLSQISASTKNAAKASASGMRSAAKKAKDKKKDMSLKRAQERNTRMAATNEGKVVKRGFMLQRRTKSSLPMKTWKKRYFVLVGEPIFELRSFESIATTKAPRKIPLTDIIEVARVEDSASKPSKGSNIGIAQSLCQVGLIQPPHFCQFELQQISEPLHMACLTSADMEDWYARVYQTLEVARVGYLEKAFQGGDFVGDEDEDTCEPTEAQMKEEFSKPLDEEADSGTLLDQHRVMRRRYTVFTNDDDDETPISKTLKRCSTVQKPLGHITTRTTDKPKDRPPQPPRPNRQPSPLSSIPPKPMPSSSPRGPPPAIPIKPEGSPRSIGMPPKPARPEAHLSTKVPPSIETIVAMNQQQRLPSAQIPSRRPDTVKEHGMSSLLPGVRRSQSAQNTRSLAPRNLPSVPRVASFNERMDSDSPGLPPRPRLPTAYRPDAPAK